MTLLEKGAHQAVNVCVQLKPDEKVVIITDKETLQVADVIKEVAEKISPGNILQFVMENFGERPSDGSHPLKFPSEIKNAMQNADVSFYAAQGAKGELATFRKPMLDFVTENKHIRHAHMININKEIMEIGMNSNYNKVKEITSKIYEAVNKAKYITVTTPAGTDFKAEFSPEIKWIKYDASITERGTWTNLPDGEVATCVYKIEKGTIVVDGVLGDYFDRKYGLLDKNPVTLHIENSRVKKIECTNKALKEDLCEYIKQDENANRIGEFAIGTNIGLTKLIGNLLQDEKFPGIHIAIGHGYPEVTGSGWTSNAHVDGVLKNPTINVDGKIIMQDGKFLI
jgi:aminopeptidase